MSVQHTRQFNTKKPSVQHQKTFSSASKLLALRQKSVSWTHLSLQHRKTSSSLSNWRFLSVELIAVLNWRFLVLNRRVCWTDNFLWWTNGLRGLKNCGPWVELRGTAIKQLSDRFSWLTKTVFFYFYLFFYNLFYLKIWIDLRVVNSINPTNELSKSNWPDYEYILPKKSN